MKIASISSKFSRRLVTPGLLVTASILITACEGGAIVGPIGEGSGGDQLPIVAGESGGSVQEEQQSLTNLQPPAAIPDSPNEITADSDTSISGPNEVLDTAGDNTFNPANTLSIEEILSNAEKTGGLRIMAVGDSITQGTRGLSSYRKSFHQLMGDSGCSFRMVGTQSKTLHIADYYGPHESYGGATAEHFIYGHQNNQGIRYSINHQKPNIILLHLGSVDIFLGQSVASTVAELDQLVATIYETKPDTVVLLANLIPTFDESNGVNQTLAELSKGIEQLVNESNYTTLSLVDVSSGYTAEMMQFDLTLPNEKGETHIANAFHTKLTSYGICE